MRRWIIVGIILLLSISGVSATLSYSYDGDGTGTFATSFSIDSGGHASGEYII